jgi:formyl-CoA transferase
VQSGPTCTQLLAWFGADVIKVERPGVGDATRKQLVDVPGADSAVFHDAQPQQAFDRAELEERDRQGSAGRLIKTCDVLVENFAPGALDRMGFGWERIQETEPAHDHGVDQGFRSGQVRRLQGL